MIPIGPFPILWHIMRYYAHFGHTEFVLCTGYKADVIKKFFVDLELHSHDFTIDFGESRQNRIQFHVTGETFRPQVTVAYTGQHTMTGARLKRVERYLGDDADFMLTYGDGLSDVDLNELTAFHQQHGKIATLTSVFPPPKFGDLGFSGDQVTSFAEKQGQQGAMVNGGFYVLNRRIFDVLSSESGCVLEKEPLESLSRDGQLMAFRHRGYWQCMDTTRDLDSLQTAWASGDAPWKVWSGGYSD